CVAGQCAYDCVEGADDCNGTCTFLGSDPENCGACGNICPDSAPICVQGACSPCYPGQTLCGNSCSDPRFDPDNCGACGNVCGDDAPNCIYGACFANGECPAGLTWCDPGCVDLFSDSFNCGACNNQCAPSEVCSGGICQGICVGCEYY